MKKILLVGGGGFAGGHLAEALSRRGHQVFSTDRAASAPGIVLLELGDEDSIRSILTGIKPDVIFHLAAQSMVPLSWEKPVMTFDINVTGSIRLFTCAQEIVPEARFIFIGSGEEYGIGCDLDHPFTETTSCSPQNPYALSKFSAGLILEQLAVRKGSDFIHLRPFNHFGPHQREGFVVSDFAAQIARIEAGKQAPLMRIGCLEAQRDFSFVTDIITAYAIMAETENHQYSTYNICSGIPRKIQSVLDGLLACSTAKIEMETDPTRYREPENPVLYASHSRFSSEFGWKPVITFEDGLARTLDYWRKKVSGNL
jgi:GDP-4-dehydro-6-deoxy-D-mannose reductase